MNTTSQLDSLRELSDAKARYEEWLGWRVSVDVGHERLVVPVGPQLGAVTMPARLAVVVTAQLRISLLAGPVVAAPGGQWHTFLTAPGKSTRQNVPPELRKARVQLVPTGGQVIIPPTFEPKHDPTSWCWVEPPRPVFALPPLSAVVVTARVAVLGEHGNLGSPSAS